MPMSLFKKLDFLGHHLGPEINNSNKYQTYFGAILSLLAAVSVLVVSFLFGLEIIEKRKPIVTSSIKKLANADTKINLNDYIVMFSALSPSSSKNIHEYFDINIKQGIFKNGKFVSNIDIELVQCNTTNVNIQTKLNTIPNLEGKENIFDRSFCFKDIDQDKLAYIQSEKNTEDSSTITIDINYCDPKNTKKICKDHNPEKIIFYLNILQSYVDNINYENPIRYYFIGIPFMKYAGFISEFNIEIYKNKYLSDNGLILEDILEIDYRSIKYFSKVLPADNEFNYSKISISSPTVIEINKRIYMKATELFAKVGGLLNAVIIISKILFGNYIRYNFFLDMTIYLNKIDSDNKIHNNIVLNSSYNKINDNHNHNINIKNNRKATNSVNNEIKNENENENENNNIKLSHDYNTDNIKKGKNNNNNDNNKLGNKQIINNYINDFNRNDNNIILNQIENVKTNYIEYLFMSFTRIFSNKNNKYTQIFERIKQNNEYYEILSLRDKRNKTTL